MKVYEVLARLFVHNGVDTVFGLMGTCNMAWMSTLEEELGVKTFHARHENPAVGMAAAFAQVSGRIGVCSVTCGPGFVQALTALVAARHRQVSIVLFSGEAPVGIPYHHQQVDQSRLAASIGVPFVRINSKRDLFNACTEAFSISLASSVPVILSAPQDLQNADLDISPPEIGNQKRVIRSPDPPTPITPSAIDPIVRAISASSRPLVLAGWGAVIAGAFDDLVALAEKLDAPLATTLKAKGLFDDVGRNLGIAGWLATPENFSFMKRADLVIAVGARLGYFTTANGSLFENARIVAINASPQNEVEGQRRADIYLQANARDALRQLNDRLISGTNTEWGGVPTSGSQIESIDENNDVDPRKAIHSLNLALSPEAVVVIGLGHFWEFAIAGLKNRRPENFVWSYDFGAIGQGIANAVGAAVATNCDRPVVLIEGDGSLMMYLSELETIARYQLPVMVVVMNDGAYGAELHRLREDGFSGESAIHGRVALHQTARSLGLRAVKITDHSQLALIVKDFEEDRSPLLVDIPSSLKVVSKQLPGLALPGGQVSSS